MKFPGLCSAGGQTSWRERSLLALKCVNLWIVLVVFSVNIHLSLSLPHPLSNYQTSRKIIPPKWKGKALFLLASCYSLAWTKGSSWNKQFHAIGRCCWVGDPSVSGLVGSSKSGGHFFPFTEVVPWNILRVPPLTQMAPGSIPIMRAAKIMQEILKERELEILTTDHCPIKPFREKKTRKLFFPLTSCDIGMRVVSSYPWQKQLRCLCHGKLCCCPRAATDFWCSPGCLAPFEIEPQASVLETLNCETP